MKKAFLSIVVLLNLSGLWAQKYQKAIITDVRFFRRTGAYVNNETFPFYFHHKEFVQDVFGDIQKYVSNHYKIDSNNIQFPDSINYSEGLFLPKIKLKDKAKAGNPGELFISVETILQESSVVNGEINYAFVTKIKAVNSYGKPVSSFKNKIPFTVLLDESVTATVEMGETDFYVFYFDGLEMAFKDIGTLPKRYIYKPQTQDYSEFLNIAEIFFMKLEGKSYFYGPDANNQTSVLKFYDVPEISGAKQLSYNDFNYIIWDRYLALNSFSEDTLQVQLRYGDNFWLLKADENHPVGVEITQKGQSVGLLESLNDTLIKGDFAAFEYTFVWNNKNQVTEIYIGDQLSYIVNILGDDRIIYVHPAVTESQLKDFFSLVFAKDFLDALTKYRYE